MATFPSPYSYLASLGGGGHPDVVPAPNPARQDLAHGTPTTTVSFAAPSGGSGSGFSYSASLSKPSGSSAGLTGVGLGPYTLSSMADGESYGVLLTATDNGDGQVASNFALVDVSSTSAQPSEFFIPSVQISVDSIPVYFAGGDEFVIPNVTVVP